VSVDTAGGRLRIVNVHLMAPGKSAAGVFWGVSCRSRQLAQVFDGLPGDAAALVTAGATIVAGDFNLDPVRLIGEPEAEIWRRHVGEGRRFTDLTPRAPSGSQYGTRRGSLGIALDHVLADRARGRCTVHGHGIGVDPGTESLDAGFDWGDLPGGSGYASRIDHFAITCELTLDLSG
jgi:endonuclease/exonuclease/phosphatase family metal-dependent hydrolase